MMKFYYTLRFLRRCHVNGFEILLFLVSQKTSNVFMLEFK